MKHSHHTSGPQTQHAAHPKGDAPAAKTSHPDAGMEVQIREAAYYRYLARGAEAGHELEDWLQAESELSGRGKPQDISH